MAWAERELGKSNCTTALTEGWIALQATQPNFQAEVANLRQPPRTSGTSVSTDAA